MKTSKSKNTTRKISFIRDYSSLAVPIAIGLVGLVLLILTPLLLGSKLRQQIIDESITKRGREVELLNRGENAVSSKQWKVEQQYQQHHQQDANQIDLVVKQTTQRPLLSCEIFPEPKDTSLSIFKEFGQQFRHGIDELLARENAGECPTDAELQRHLSGLPVSYSDWRGSYQSLGEEARLIVDALCQEKAESARVYANPIDLSGYEFWEEYKYADYAGVDEAVKDCWFLQLAYWIIEDVIDTIRTLNSDSKNVLTSPVKRLLDVSFGMGKGMGEKRLDRPYYVTSSNGGLVERSLTARVCNEDIDVVHFSVTLVVSSKAVLPLMQQLCSAKTHKFRGFSGLEKEQIFKHNQITILKSRIYPIEAEKVDYNYESHDLYRYGDDAVVQMDLICEYVFSKSGYDEIKPESVKKMTTTNLDSNLRGF